jgi:hypothetical protein
MFSAGFEPATPAIEGSQIYALIRTDTEICMYEVFTNGRRRCEVISANINKTQATQ